MTQLLRTDTRKECHHKVLPLYALPATCFLDGCNHGVK